VTASFPQRGGRWIVPPVTTVPEPSTMVLGLVTRVAMIASGVLLWSASL